MTGPWVILLFSQLGCHRDKDGGGDSSGSEAPACDVVALDQSWPDDGLSPASRDIRLSVAFSGEVSAEGVGFSVTDADGAEVSGAVTLTETDGVITGATWAPDALLEADTAYSWTVDVCSATGGGGFTTGEHGDRVDPTVLADTSFDLDLYHATWVEPEGGASVFRSLFDGLLLLGVESADDANIDLIAAVGQQIDEETIYQDPCFETANFEATAFQNNPYATVGPTTLTLDVQGIPAPLQNVKVSGAFIDGGAALAGGTLEAELDARDVAASIGYTEDQVCELLETFVQIDCVPCDSDGESYCVGLELTDVEGALVPGLRLVPNENPSECDTSGA